MCFAFSCSVRESDSQLDDTRNVALEDFIIQQIFDIEEVRHNKLMKSIKNASPYAEVHMRPRYDESFYWIRAGYTSNDSVVLLYDFYFYPSDSIIEILDPEQQVPVSLEQWRENKETVLPTLQKPSQAFY